MQQFLGVLNEEVCSFLQLTFLIITFKLPYPTGFYGINFAYASIKNVVKLCC